LAVAPDLFAVSAHLFIPSVPSDMTKSMPEAGHAFIELSQM